MSFETAPTFAEIYDSVRLRAGAGAVTLSASQVATVKELINQSQYELYVEAEWVALRTFSDVTITADVTDYNWPDAATSGSVNRVIIYNDDASVFYELQPDDSVYLRQLCQTSGNPRYYYVRDGVIRIMPPPVDTWNKLHIEFTQKPTRLVNDSDRCVVDGEALRQRATIKVQTLFGISSTNSAAAAHVRYLELLRSQQGPSESFGLASETAQYPNNAWSAQMGTYGIYNGSQNSYGPDWKPW